VVVADGGACGEFEAMRRPWVEVGVQQCWNKGVSQVTY